MQFTITEIERKPLELDVLHVYTVTLNEGRDDTGVIITTAEEHPAVTWRQFGHPTTSNIFMVAVQAAVVAEALRIISNCNNSWSSAVGETFSLPEPDQILWR
jgi:hypothetical protein